MSASSSAFTPRPNRVLAAVLLVVVLAVALLPWWHNRGYIRSFYDYGVIMGGAGRLESGQKPYVDFVVPIQTGWFFFNWAAERIAGGTFQAMTWSGAACITLATLALGGMLLRRWPVGPAIIVTAAIVCASVSQHTILWYNPWGVVLLAVVAWGGAVAPVWRREHAGWQTLIVAALFLGGINKINMQLMALCLALGWAVRAAWLARATWARVAGTAGLYFLGGIVLPVLAEMAWTGATFAQWWHNVIAQMAGSRSGMMVDGLQWRFFLVPCHDYYGALRLPWVGLAGVLLTLATIVALLQHVRGERAGLERGLVGLCGLIAFLGGEVLLTTNMDIAYTALGGWLALLVALWLGFGGPARGGWFWGGLVLPALVIGAVSWESAWRGQRSQFGHSHAPRSAYRLGEEAGPDFGYLQGTRIPPDIFAGLKAMGEWRAALPPERRQAILYGPGTEMAAHFWPALRTPEVPLYMLGGYQFGPQEYAAIRAAVASGRGKEIIVTEVQDLWTPELKRLLSIKYQRMALDGPFFRYSRPVDDGFSADPLYFIQHFGGTTDVRGLKSDGAIFDAAGQRLFVGTDERRESMRVTALTNRLSGEVIVRRRDQASPGALAANFSIFAEYDAKHRYPRWSQRVELPAGQDEIVVKYAVDSSHMVSLQEVEIPPEFAGRTIAGWRGPSIMDSGEDGPTTPRWLHGGAMNVSVLRPDEIAALLPADTTWLPRQMILRGGRVAASGLELDPGGELWIRVEGRVTEFSGSVHVAAGPDTGPWPVVRSIWLKNARLEVCTQMGVRPADRSAEFRMWSAEPGGWLVLAIDPVAHAPAVSLRINRLIHQGEP